MISSRIKKQIKYMKVPNILRFLQNSNRKVFYQFHITNFSTSSRDQNYNTNEPFPKFDKKDFYDEHDLIINIGEKDTFKGLLVICPTPIGNINDISLRQYEAMKNGDILACEDTRKTGKLLEFVKLKKMKEKFYSEFGINFEDFVNYGGLDMTDEQIKKEFFEKKKDNNNNENYNDFYETKEEVKKSEDFNNFNRGEINSMATDNTSNSASPKSKSIYNKSSVLPKEVLEKNDFYKKMSKRVKEKVEKEMNVSDLQNITEEINLNFSEANKKEIIDKIKDNLKEPLTTEYYSQVQNNTEFMLRKTVIENSEEEFRPHIEPLAESYDDNLKLSYKLRNKAKFIMGMTKKYKIKEEEKEDSEKNIEEELEEDMSEHLSLSDNIFGLFKKRIREEKEKKGRGLLVPFNQENEDKKIPKLIRAMKMGLRVVLISDAGTPTISDPGYKLVKEASKNGIIVEALPGPSAVITALSACGLPTDKFMFVGYLPKNPNEKKEKIESIKKMNTTTVIFESPHRIKNSLETIGEIISLKHQAYIGLELTKKFENHMYGTIEQLKQQLDKQEEIKGEITLILAPYLKSPEELEEEKSLNDMVTIEALEFAQKVNSILKLSDKEFRSLLSEICNVSKIKADKIINTVKNRESSLKTFMTRTGIREVKIKEKKLEDFLTSDNQGEGKMKNMVRVIKKKKPDKKPDSIVDKNKNTRL